MDVLAVGAAKYEHMVKMLSAGVGDSSIQAPPLDPWKQLVDRLENKPEQLKVLRLLKTDGRHELRQLVKMLGAKSTRELGGLLGAIRRTTLRAGFKSTDDVISKKGGVYLPGPALMANELPPSKEERASRYDLMLEDEKGEP